MARLPFIVKRFGLGLVAAIGMWVLLQLSPLGDLLYFLLPSHTLVDRGNGGARSVPSMSGGRQIGWGDHNGDGRLDVIAFNKVGLIGQDFTGQGARVMWSYNFDPRFSIPGHYSLPPEGVSAYRFYVGPSCDVNGDGADEGFVTCCTLSGDRWLLDVVDGPTGNSLLKVDLPVGEDKRQDGQWDGNYFCEGVLEVPGAEGPMTRLAILSRVVKYDRLGRGIMAVDLATGKEAWFRPLANNPHPGDVLLVDLDGDGCREVALAGSGPGNLKPGEDVEGLLDDRARIIVIGADGLMRWQKPLAETWGSSGILAAQDLDSDGLPELIVGTSNALVGHTEYLRVFRGDGRLLCQYPLPDKTIAVTPLEVPGDDRQLYVTTLGDECLGFALADTGLVLRSRDGNIPAARSRGPVALGGRPGYMLATDQDRILLFHPQDGWSKVVRESDKKLLEIYPVPQPDGEMILAVLTDHWRFLNLEPTPNRLAATMTLLALPPLVALVPPRWYRRRRRRQSGVLGPAREEVKREIARRLKRDNHNRLSLFRSLESLLMNLEWAQEHQVIDDHGQGLLDRLRTRCQRLAEADLPAVLEIVELVESLELAEGIGPRLVRRHDEMARFLTASLSQPDPLKALREGFPAARAAARDMEVDLEKLAREFAAYEGVDLWEVIQDVLLDHRDTVERCGVQVSVAPHPADDVRVILPREDLKHLFDNLVRNACRAMKNSAPRLIWVRVTTSGHRVRCDFVDSGPGIAPELRASLFQAPISGSGGTGEGLYDAARLISQYNGNLELGPTEGDEGACIRLTLPFL